MKIEVFTSPLDGHPLYAASNYPSICLKVFSQILYWCALSTPSLSFICVQGELSYLKIFIFRHTATKNAIIFKYFAALFTYDLGI